MKRVNFRMNNNNRIEVMELYREGHSIAEVSAITGITKSSVQAILEYYDVNRRSQNQHQITDEEIEQIKKRVKNGELMIKIAIERNVVPSAISHLLSRRG